jgi:exodeoxyribonuclease III
MQIATWNVNSIKARAERVLRWIGREQPDVVCLQELKVPDDQFPVADFERLGYASAVHGQKTYNGVAILSRVEPKAVRRGFGDAEEETEARLIEATINGARILSVYVPNGQSVGSPKYEYKLSWMSRLLEYLHRTSTPSDDLVLCGDLNVAPDDSDVAFPEQWSESVLCHGQARAALARIFDWGLVDVFRQHHPEGGVYSWWDYRMLGFPKGNGLRIDHVLATKPMAVRCTGARIDRNERKGKLPSDHAPVIADFDDH